MANPEQVETLKKGPDLWNQWRIETPSIKIDLTEANLEGANLTDAFLTISKKITCKQIQSAKINRETQPPDYIIITWTSDDAYTCEEIEKKDGGKKE